jgi:hypothetical protein
MIGCGIGSLRLWKWIAIVALSISSLGRLVYGVLCAVAADHVYPGFTAVHRGCAMTRELGIADQSFAGALYRVASFSPIASVLGIVAFAAFVVWAYAAFAAAASVAPRGARLAAPFEIVMMWLVPLIHLFMPFWYVRDLLAACDPKDLEPVAVRTLPPSGYRTPGVETTDAWRRPWLPFRAWWTLWVVSLATYPAALYVATATWSGPGQLAFLRFEAVRAVIAIAAAIAFILVIRATTEIIEERARRRAAIDRA